MLKQVSSGIYRVVAELRGIMTSKEKLKQVFSVPLYTNTVYLAANTAVTAVLGLFFWMVVARFYTKAEVGSASAIIASISLIALFSRLGLDFSLIRFLPHAERPEELINSCFTISGLTSLVVAGIFIAGLHFWSPALSFITKKAVFSLAFLVFALVWTLSWPINATFVAKRKAQFVLFKNTIFSLLKIFLSIIFALFFRTFGIVSSWGVAIMIALAVSFFLFLPKVQNPYKPKPTLKLSLIKDIWKYSTGNYLACLFEVAPALVLPIMVVNLLGAADNAYFYIAWMVAALLFAIPSGACQSLFAEGSQFKERLGENVVKSFKFTYSLLVPSVLLFIFLGDWLLGLFGTGYSANSLRLLQLLSLSSLLYAVNSIYLTTLRVKGQIRELVVIVVFVALSILLTSYFLIPTTGIIGAGYAWLGAQGAVTIYALLVFYLQGSSKRSF